MNLLPAWPRHSINRNASLGGESDAFRCRSNALGWHTVGKTLYEMINVLIFYFSWLAKILGKLLSCSYSDA